MDDSAVVTAMPPVSAWQWRGHCIAYRACGDRGPPAVMVHGFGACSGHWRHNLAELGRDCRCYAIDLLGFGASAKPPPSPTVSYTFETWGQQVADFCREVVGEPAFLVGNSIGCIAAMQAAVTHPERVLGVAAINFSLRRLHERKRGNLLWYRRWSAPLAQRLLSVGPIGRAFFRRLARAGTVRRILQQAYPQAEAVTDELVALLLEPARDPGAAEVFIAFVNYSGGPLPEELLPELACPALVLWGTADPWEPVELGRQAADWPTVERFVPLPGLGHCPHDEAPERVNPLLRDWLLAHWPR
jgi:pimeloyl-ACP methyl ester carboxylesterase